MGEVLDRLHLVVGGEQIGADGQCPVVGQEHAVVRLDVLAHGVRQLARGRRGVLRDGHAAERSQHFGKHGAIERDTCHGEARGHGRVRVDDRAHVGPVPVHLEVHEHLGRGIAIALYLFALEVRDAHHVGRHEPLAHALGRHHQTVRAEAGADVAVVAGRVAAGVHATAHLDDVGAERGLSAHDVRPRYWSRQLVEQK